MNARRSIRRAGLIALLALVMLPLAARAATAAAPVVRAGDQVIVGAQGAALMVGQDVLARLSSGQKLPIMAVQGTWLGTSVIIGNKSVQGWVPSTDVALAQAAEPGAQPAAGYELGDWDYNWSGHHAPDPNLATWEPWRYCALIQAWSPAPRRATSYEPGEWDFNWSGHSEPNPNLHTWEPWRFGEVMQARSIFD